ncbi:hypothetical protein BC940DRAFT_87789 [Gongronella butleri]|nr:hypothetical protein BC940DRAFT_87789 [Gongronella butleri]
MSDHGENEAKRSHRQRPSHAGRGPAAAAGTKAALSPVQVLERILTPSQSGQRASLCNQLDTMMQPRGSEASPSWQQRQDMMSLVEMCLQATDLLASTLEGRHAAWKDTLARVVANAACCTRLDLVLRWAIDLLLLVDGNMLGFHAWLLRLLRSSIVVAANDPFLHRQYHDQYASAVLHTIGSILDRPDAAPLLPAMLDLLTTLHTHHSAALVPHFQHITDMLTSWYLDPSSKPPERVAIQDALECCTSCWPLSHAFAVDMLQNLKDDLAERLATPESIPWDDCVHLIEFIGLVLRCIHASIGADEALAASFASLQHELVTLLSSQMYRLSGNPRAWLEPSNHVALLLFSLSTDADLQFAVYNYLGAQTSLLDAAILIGYAMLMARHAALSLDLAARMLAPDAPLPLQLLATTTDATVVKGVLLLVRHLFVRISGNGTRVAGLARAYTDLIQPQIAQSIDLDAQPGHWPSISPDMAPSTDAPLVLPPVNYAKLLLMAVTSTRAIVAYDEKELCDALVARVMHTTFWMWRDGEFGVFDAMFGALLDFWASDGDALASATRAFVHDAAGAWDTLPLGSKRALLRFFTRRVDTAADAVWLATTLLRLFDQLAFETHDAIKQAILVLFADFYRKYPSTIDALHLNKITYRLLECMKSPSEPLQQWSSRLLAMLNPFVIYQGLEKWDKTRILKGAIMKTPHTGMFRPVHYEIAMRHMGMQRLLVDVSARHGTVGDHGNDDDNEWARRLLHACDGLRSLRGNLTTQQMAAWINDSSSLLMYWTMWEASRYCILSRLRTPFGNPQQTFAALEKQLHELVKEKRADSALENLLLLLDRLEIQIEHATDASQGASPSISVIPTVPKASFTFFHTNRKTCHDYYARIRPLIIQGAKLFQWHMMVLKHTATLVSDLALSSSSDTPANALATQRTINGHVRDMVDICIDHGYGDMIGGLKSWYRHMCIAKDKDWAFFGDIGPLPAPVETPILDLSWFDVAQQFAVGHDELAIDLLAQYTLDASQDADGVLHMLQKHALDFYTSLQDYETTAAMCERHPYLFSGQLAQTMLDHGKELNLSDSHARLASYSTIDASITSALENDTSSAALDACVHVHRLISSMTRDSPCSSSSAIASRLVQRVRHAQLDQQIQGHDLLEFQVVSQQRDAPTLLHDHAAHWLSLYEARRTPTTPTTKQMARMAQALAQDDDLAAPLQLATAQIARRSGNKRTAHAYLAPLLEKDASPSPMVTQLAKYERILLDLTSNVPLATPLADLAALAQQLNAEDVVVDNNCNVKLRHELVANVYMKMADLLQEGEARDVLDLAQLQTLVTNVHGLGPPNTHVHQDKALWLAGTVNHMYQKAVDAVDNHWAKPWYVYASHHYDRAYAILDAAHQLAIGNTTNMPLLHATISSWHDILVDMDPCTRDDVKKFFWSLFDTFSSVADDDDHGDLQHGAHFSASTTTRDKLAQHQEILSVTTDAQRHEMLLSLDVVHGIVVDHLRSAVMAYTHYLEVVDAQQDPQVTSRMTLATLRLVQILGQHGALIPTAFDTSDRPWGRLQSLTWKQITPQLFSRLQQHPSTLVKQTLGHWTARLVDTYPNDLVYPLIVHLASSSASTSADTDATHAILQKCAARIQAQDTTGDLWLATCRMTEELEKMTVLWEERWLHEISALQLQVMHQWHVLDQHVKQHAPTLEAFQQQYASLMRPTVESIAHLMKRTIDTPHIMTRHEQWFNAAFGKPIRRAFDLFRRPESIRSYRKGWDRFLQIHRGLTAETHKLRVIDLERISPYLASLRGNTSIQIPGTRASSTSIHLDHFGSTVMILPTKTKPKKVDMYGTDGVKYMYLFKGMEDLHLDERIMQLLTTINLLLQEDAQARARDLYARTYAVTPLSQHGGMIQWVQHATPLFAFYKHWLQQEARDRPPFADLMVKELKASGAKASTHRRHWPARILKKVFKDLVDATPRDLFARALWQNSQDGDDWVQKTTRLARSMAVMSMIGYIIGLGDRHLDNVLLDDTTGDLIHIDYNVCFEKGKTLRVPERVPFRLTGNMVHALGLTRAPPSPNAASSSTTPSLDGLYRTSAIHTLRVLREHKDLLVGLLDDNPASPSRPILNPAIPAHQNQAGFLDRKDQGQGAWTEIMANLATVATRLVDGSGARDALHKQQVQEIHALLHQIRQQSIRDKAQTGDDGNDGDDDYADDDQSAADDDDTPDQWRMEQLMEQHNSNKSKIDLQQAKQSLLLLVKDCQDWSARHQETLAGLKSMAIQTKQGVTGPGVLAEVDVGQAREWQQWRQLRDATNQQCATDLAAYQQWVAPLASKVLAQQDTCTIYARLVYDALQPMNNPVVSAGTPLTGASSATAAVSSPATPSSTAAAATATSTATSPSAAEALHALYDELGKNRKHGHHAPDRDDDDDDVDDNDDNDDDVQDDDEDDDDLDDTTMRDLDAHLAQFTNLLHGHLNSLKSAAKQLAAPITTSTSNTSDQLPSVLGHLIALLTRVPNESTINDKETSIITRDQLQLESQVYIGSLNHDNNGWVTLASYLPAIAPFLKDHLTKPDLEFVSLLPQATQRLFQFETACWDFCQRIYDSLFQSQKLVEELTNYMETTNHNIMMQNTSDLKKKPKLWRLVRDLYAPLDKLCGFFKDDAGSDASDAVLQAYNRMKKLVVTQLLHKIIKQFNSIPSDAWISPLLSSWALSFNDGIVQSLRNLTDTFLKTIHIPLCLRHLTQWQTFAPTSSSANVMHKCRETSASFLHQCVSSQSRKKSGAGHFVL